MADVRSEHLDVETNAISQPADKRTSLITLRASDKPYHRLATFSNSSEYSRNVDT